MGFSLLDIFILYLAALRILSLSLIFYCFNIMYFEEFLFRLSKLGILLNIWILGSSPFHRFEKLLSIICSNRLSVPFFLSSSGMPIFLKLEAMVHEFMHRWRLAASPPLTPPSGLIRAGQSRERDNKEVG